MNKRLNQLSLTSQSVYLVVMIIFSIIILMPFLVMVFTSLKSAQEIRSTEFKLLPNTPIWGNYTEAMTSSNWGRFFGNSVYITLMAVISSLVINSLAGYAFARMKFKGRDILFFIALTGMMIPMQVTMLPNFVIMRYFPLFGGNNIFGQGGTGLINTYLGILAPNLVSAEQLQTQDKSTTSGHFLVSCVQG